MPVSLSSFPHMSLFCNIPFLWQRSSRTRNNVRMTGSGQRVQWCKAREPVLHRHSQELQRPCLALRTAALFLQRDDDEDVPFHTQDAQTTTQGGTFPPSECQAKLHQWECAEWKRIVPYKMMRRRKIRLQWTISIIIFPATKLSGTGTVKKSFILIIYLIKNT